MKFFEADSTQEMAYLIKTYGYEAVDKQDQRLYSGGRFVNRGSVIRGNQISESTDSKHESVQAVSQR